MINFFKSIFVVISLAPNVSFAEPRSFSSMEECGHWKSNVIKILQSKFSLTGNDREFTIRCKSNANKAIATVTLTKYVKTEKYYKAFLKTILAIHEQSGPKSQFCYTNKQDGSTLPSRTIASHLDYCKQALDDINFEIKNVLIAAGGAVKNRKVFFGSTLGCTEFRCCKYSHCGTSIYEWLAKKKARIECHQYESYNFCYKGSGMGCHCT